MLKTNSKVVRQKIRNYIEKQAKDELVFNYGISASELNSFSNIAKNIIACYHEETKFDSFVRKHGYTFEIFCDWAQGLPMGGLFLYYYSISAVNLVKGILEETETEASKYTESQAEDLLTRLIYKELINT